MAAEGLVAPGGAGLPPNETEQPMAGQKTVAVEWTWPPGWPMLGTGPKRERTTECDLPQSACCAMPCGACLVLRLVGKDAASFALPSTNVKPAYGGVGAAQVFPFFSADVDQIISEPATASTQDNKSAQICTFFTYKVHLAMPPEEDRKPTSRSSAAYRGCAVSRISIIVIMTTALKSENINWYLQFLVLLD